MPEESNACVEQEMPDDLKQWLESLRQPFSRILKDIYDDLFQKEFQKRLTWKDEMLWYEDLDQGDRYSVSDLACGILKVEKYYDGLVGPREGLDSRNRGKEGKSLAIFLLEQELGRFLDEYRAEDVDRKAVIHRFRQMFVETIHKKLMWNSELLQNTNRMLLRGYLKPAFEHLKSDLTRPDGSVNTCAVELLPAISAMALEKTAEELDGFSRDAAVVKVLLQNLVHGYFYTQIAE